MHLPTNFSVLLMAVIFVLFTEAAVVPKNPNTPRSSITFPLRSLHGSVPRDIHPLIHLQQRINRADRRLARMTGSPIPTDDELRARLHKRIAIIEGGPATSDHKGHRKRDNPVDLMATNSTINGTAISRTVIQTLHGRTNVSHVGRDSLGTAPNSLGLSIVGADDGYVMTIPIGTPAANFQITVDSGSADFWVGSEQCQIADSKMQPTGEGCGQHRFLGTKSSSTFVDSQEMFIVVYGIGFVVGTVVRDNVQIAGLGLVNHTFGVAKLESVDQAQFPVDGLMGTAKSSMSQQKIPTPVEALHNQGLISAAIVSYKLSRLADGKNDGEVTFGALDTTKFDPTTLVTMPVVQLNNPGFWLASMDAITVDGQNPGLSKRTAIFDTGTTLILAPPADAIAIHKLIDGAKDDGQGGFLVPCNTNASVSLTFGGRAFAIDSRDLATFPPSNGMCSSGIAATSVSQTNDVWLLGDVFIKNAYFSTDVGKDTVSLAKLV